MKPSSKITTSLFQCERLNFSILSLLRPESRNAISIQMLDELRLHIKNLKEQQKSQTRALMLWSPSKKSFCSGADLKERAKMTSEQANHFVNKLRDTFTEFSELPFPTVACIDGPALGGGLELALCCDFRVSSSKAIFGLPEASLSIIPGAGGTQRLPRLIGIQRAKYMSLTSEKISATKALQFGLIDNAGEFYKNDDDVNPISIGNYKGRNSENDGEFNQEDSTSITNSTQTNSFSNYNNSNINIPSNSNFGGIEYIPSTPIGNLFSEVLETFSKEEKLGYAAYQSESLWLAWKIIEPILKNGPIAVKLIKSSIDVGANLDLKGGLKVEKENYKLALNSPR